MRFKLLAAVLGIAILFASVATAAQAKKKYPTRIKYLDRSLVSPPSRDTVFSGALKSPKRGCELARLVAGYKNPGTGFKFFDVGITSRNSAWAVRGLISPGSQVKIVAQARRTRHYVCKRASIIVPPTR